MALETWWMKPVGLLSVFHLLVLMVIVRYINFIAFSLGFFLLLVYHGIDVGERRIEYRTSSTGVNALNRLSYKSLQIS